MNHDRTKRAEEVFLAVADLARERWPEEISARCNGDAALAADVRALLDCHAEADSFLDARELQGEGLQFGLLEGDLEDDLRPGFRLGEFQIERLLGRGGMGSVFVATQDRPRRSVALKVIRRGLATPGLLRRFEHEAEVLGRLQHPGIAQIYEAGVARLTGADGSPTGEIPRPYIAMELVNGSTLNAYAEAHGLGTRERLAMVAQVCDAVHHAHQRGVIHRDLKPGNILVDESGQAKVLDFGVARAADADLRVTTMQTSVGQLIGTLPYMSPEQVLADPAEVDNRSDVYALGVILFQLLTGRLPLDLRSRSIPEAARVIKEESPEKLSHVSKVFRGEVDTIVSKALEKNKERRYQSAADLAGDIRRHLGGEPILARQDSALYVLRKQFRRHRWMVAGGAAFLVGLLAFSIYAGWSARTERRLAESEQRARRDAEREKSISDGLNGRLQDELTQANIERGRLEGATGNLPLAEDILWAEYLKNPASPAAYWGLWELYSRYPTLWTVAGDRAITCAAVSPDGSVVAIGTRSGTLVLYHGANGQRFRTIERLGATVSQVVITPDASAAALVLETGPTLLVPLRTTDPVRPLTATPIRAGEARALAISPDGTMLATGGNAKNISLWNLGAGTLIGSWPAHGDPVSALAFSADGTRLASACRQVGGGPDASVWSVPDGRKVADLNRERFGYTWGLMYAGPFLLSSSNEGSAAWYDPASAEPRPLRGVYSYGGSATASVSPKGGAVYVGGLDSLYRAGNATPARMLGRPRSRAIASGWLDENTLLIVTGEGTIRAMDVRESPGVRRFTDFKTWCHSVAFAPDGKLVAMGGGDGTVAIADAATLEPRAIVNGPAPNHRTRSLIFLADSTTLLAGGMDGAVRIIDAPSGQVLHLMRQARSEIFSQAVDPAQRTLAVGHADGVVRVWDLATRSFITELPKMNARAVGLAFSRDGESLITPFGETNIVVWNTRTWTERARIDVGHTPWAVAFSPGGQTLLATTYAGTIEVIDWPSMTRRAALLGHQRLIPTVAYSPDGRFFATGSEHGTVKLWDAASLRTLATFEPEAIQVTSVAFDPSSNVLAAGVAARAAVFFDLHAMDGCIEGNAPFERARRAASPP